MSNPSKHLGFFVAKEKEERNMRKILFKWNSDSK
jgi:hypothetical protein